MLVQAIVCWNYGLPLISFHVLRNLVSRSESSCTWETKDDSSCPPSEEKASCSYSWDARAKLADSVVAAKESRPDKADHYGWDNRVQEEAPPEPVFEVTMNVIDFVGFTKVSGLLMLEQLELVVHFSDPGHVIGVPKAIDVKKDDQSNRCTATHKAQEHQSSAR